MSKTTHVPTLSEFLQLCFKSAKCAQPALLVTLYQIDKDASHSGCSSLASRIFFRLITRTKQSSQTANYLSSANFACCEVGHRKEREAELTAGPLFHETCGLRLRPTR